MKEKQYYYVKQTEKSEKLQKFTINCKHDIEIRAIEAWLAREFLIAIANVYARGDSESGLDTFLRTLSVMIVSQHSYISLKYFQYATLT